jgi:hypothetical protein
MDDNVEIELKSLRSTLDVHNVSSKFEISNIKVSTLCNLDGIIIIDL